MFPKISRSLLVLALAQAPSIAAADTIRVIVEDGQKRAEFRLNGELDCVLEDQQIKCAPVSR